nr:MAG TPA: hypothetical protein [Caudoviricetes sp.]
MNARNKPYRAFFALLHSNAKAPFYAHRARKKARRALFVPKFARHGVKLYSPWERPRKKRRAERTEDET